MGLFEFLSAISNFNGDYDRTSTNDDGTTFYGVDDGQGRTTWYDNDGNCDCSTDTPCDD